MLKDLAINPYRQSDEGILTHYDVKREKWLSIERQIFWFGINQKNVRGTRWLHIKSGIPSNNAGYLMLRSAVITAISVHTKNEIIGIFEVLKANGNKILEANLNQSSKYICNHRNINIHVGDELSARIISNKPVHYPSIMLEVAWRV